MQTVNTVLNTAGNGLWSNTAKAVNIVGLDMGYVNDEKDFGELRVYFDTKTWDVNAYGLIYTDTRFARQIGYLFDRLSMDGSDISYSEQGMQGDNYVSFDVGAKFIESYSTITQLESML